MAKTESGRDSCVSEQCETERMFDYPQRMDTHWVGLCDLGYPGRAAYSPRWLYGVMFLLATFAVLLLLGVRYFITVSLSSK